MQLYMFFLGSNDFDNVVIYENLWSTVSKKGMRIIAIDFFFFFFEDPNSYRLVLSNGIFRMGQTIYSADTNMTHPKKMSISMTNYY